MSGTATKRLPHVERRRQILDSARRLASAEGLAAINMEAVAREAGVTKPVVYACFANADEVIEELIDREGRRVIGEALALVPEPADVDPVALAVEGVAAYLRLVRGNPDAWRILLAVEGFPPAAYRARERLRTRMHRDLVAVLEWGLEQRAAGPMDAPLLAHLLMSGLDRAARLILDDPEEWSDARLAAFATQVIGGIWSG